jgi:signal transduction histidine kinase
MKWSASAVFTALAFAFIAGLLLFFFLMRKLRVLSLAMQEFKDNNLSQTDTISNSVSKPQDEIETMASTFQEMAQRIHSQMQHLQEMESLRRELVANVSHDLRTPLASLSGFLETLQLKSTDLSEAEKQNYLKIAWDNAQRLTALVEELFELAKLDANEIQPQREQFSPAELAFDISHQFYLRAREKNIDFEVVADASVPQISADVGMIERVLENLIDNSFKYTPEQGQIRLQLSALQGHVEISVSDNGCGIAAEELPHILKRFYRKIDKQDSSGAQPGLGLGLAIASRIVEMHGSQLTVESELSRGTVFSFALPACT